MFYDGKQMNKKTKTKKNDEDNYVCDLVLLENPSIFGELKYDAYLTCCFVQLILKVEVILINLELWVEFVVGCIEKIKTIPGCLKQHC